MKNFLPCLLIAFIGLSCHTRRFQAICPSDARIIGFKELLPDNKLKDTLNIILVHGMGLKEPNHFDEFWERIAEGMDFEPSGSNQFRYPTDEWLTGLG